MHSHHHPESPEPGKMRKLITIALVLTLSFAVIEAVFGLLAQSLALLGDAGHMLTDSTALALALLASWIATRSPTTQHSYGLGRAEIIAALLNGLVMLAVIVGIVVAAIDRFSNPQTIDAPVVIVVASLGLVLNLVILRVLRHGSHNLNVRGAMLHVMGDLLGSIAALLSGVIIYLTSWYLIDPILSLLICILILVSSIRLIMESVHVLMEGVPAHLNIEEIGKKLAGSHPDIISIHDLHVWMLSGKDVAISAHVVVKDTLKWEEVLAKASQMLNEQYKISHITLQPENAYKTEPIHFYPKGNKAT